MGREIRRVPPDWKHPTEKREHAHWRTGKMYRPSIPLHDKSYEDALASWMEERRAWVAGENPDRQKHKKDDGSEYAFEEWSRSAPRFEAYRPAWPEESRTAYQVYETVSEGTPVSPVFATRDELISWLVNCGDGMGIGGDTYRMSYEQAERFVDAAWAPSMIMRGNGMENGIAIHDEATAWMTER